jgi:hypothetical protein
MRGVLDQAGYQREADLLRSTLAASSEKHWREFLAAWPA